MKSSRLIVKSLLELFTVLIFIFTFSISTLAVDPTVAGSSLIITKDKAHASSVVLNQPAESRTWLAAAELYYAPDWEGLEKMLRQAMIDREAELNIVYLGSFSDTIKIMRDFDGFLEGIWGYDDPATSSDFDYLYYSYQRIQVDMSQINANMVMTFSMEYLTSADDERFVDSRVAEMLEELDIGEASQYEKVKAVHDYIVNHVDYDDAEEKHSAYDALADGETVCQGYALLTYKILTEVGVACRIISGTGDGGGHAWNIVGIGDDWYNLDVTWDDTAKTNIYFLKGENKFGDHVRDDEYLTRDFLSQYPMSWDNFDRDEDDVTLVAGITLDQNAASLTPGTKLQLAASIRPEDASDTALAWSSSDPVVATVDINGLVTAIKPGSAVITASAAGKQSSDTCKITVFDLSTASSWSRQDIASLCQRGVIPGGVLADLRAGISRGEFTALLVNIYEQAQGSYDGNGSAPFVDISGSLYRMEIIKGYGLGIINGTGGGFFDPDSGLTREQCAKIIAATAALINGSGGSTEISLPFCDTGRISPWALPFVRQAYGEGLMEGMGADFSPQGKLTREQALVIAERMIEKYGW